MLEWLAVAYSSGTFLTQCRCYITLWQINNYMLKFKNLNFICVYVF